MSGTPLRRRVLALLGCLALGALAAVALDAWTGSPYAALAVPAAVALGWLLLADPTRCVPAPRRPHADAPAATEPDPP